MRAFEGQLRNIHRLQPWSLCSVLTEKYGVAPSDAAALSDFLLPMLDYNIKRRATAAQALRSPWLADA
jgi:serine/threonine protein kinase